MSLLTQVVLVIVSTSSTSTKGENAQTELQFPDAFPTININMSTALGIVSYIFAGFGILTSNAPVVEISSGKVQGKVATSRGGREYYAYLGIRYAKPPVGDLRFEPPVPPDPWKGIFKATEYGFECMQFDTVNGRLIGEEDCLFLNIYVPKVPKATGRLPVLVKIHGGSLISGNSAYYGPKYWMDEDIIVVTMNHRLYSLGFLNTGDDLIRGNMGYKDQSMVLRFCQENIRRFGGDPDRITLMGEDAGAVGAHFHILSPLSKGLFSKAILQSGTAAMAGAFVEDPTTQSKRFGKRVGCLVRNTTALVMCLKRKRAKVLIRPSADTMSPIHDPRMVFGATLEAVRREDTFLFEHPMSILEQGNFNAVPVIMGVTSAEGCFKSARVAANSHVQENMGYHWKEWAPRFLNFDPEDTETAEHIRQYYFGDGRTANPGDDLESFTQMISDGMYYHPLKHSAIRHARHAPVYLYFYTYESKALPSTYSLVRGVSPTSWIPSEFQLATAVTHDMMKKRSRSTGSHEWGVCHGEEEILLWHFNWMSDIWNSSPDYRFSRLLLTTFVNFAEKDGFRMKFDGIPWPSIDPKEEPLPYMQLDEPARIIDEPFTKYLSFWDDLEIRNPNKTEVDYQN